MWGWPGLKQRFGKSKSIFPEQHDEQPAGDGIPAVTQGECLEVCYGVLHTHRLPLAVPAGYIKHFQGTSYFPGDIVCVPLTAARLSAPPMHKRVSASAPRKAAFPGLLVNGLSLIRERIWPDKE